MQRLDLDFRKPSRSSRWAGRVLLAVALAVTGDMAYSYLSLTRSIAHGQAEVARATGSREARKSARSVPAEELAAARETVQRLTLPWSSLFGALESAASDQVALLGIEPDPRSGKVVISGDSKDYLAALSYVLNLSRSEALSSVELVRHELKQNDPQHPVAFAVSAAWNEVKR
jgi:HAMP domain-containing protein